ncbi:MAG: hypothetical protein ACRD0K_10485 [Egibacteraceae bacterium]
MGVGRPALEGRDAEALLNLANRPLTTLDAHPLGGDLDESVQRLHELEIIATAEKLRRIAEIDARQAWRGEGTRLTTDLLAQRLHVTRAGTPTRRLLQSPIWRGGRCDPPHRSRRPRHALRFNPLSGGRALRHPKSIEDLRSERRLQSPIWRGGRCDIRDALRWQPPDNAPQSPIWRGGRCD